jgi:anaerobic ribonucleoside-triphosphate reductase activating protein
MAERICSLTGIEGVTYSGGEPALQAEGLSRLSQRVKAHGLTVVSYSGFTLEELTRSPDPAVSSWLAGLDVLIDGPYLADQAAPLLWRGSRNQRVHFLSAAYRHLAEEVERPQRAIELIAGKEGWTLTGTWEAEFQDRLKRALERGEPHE